MAFLSEGAENANNVNGCARLRWTPNGSIRKRREETKIDSMYLPSTELGVVYISPYLILTISQSVM